MPSRVLGLTRRTDREILRLLFNASRKRAPIAMTAGPATPGPQRAAKARRDPLRGPLPGRRGPRQRRRHRLLLLSLAARHEPGSRQRKLRRCLSGNDDWPRSRHGCHSRYCIVAFPVPADFSPGIIKMTSPEERREKDRRRARIYYAEHKETVKERMRKYARDRSAGQERALTRILAALNELSEAVSALKTRAA